MKLAVHLMVNGQEREVSVDTRTLLVDMLREELGLTGTHVGCGTGTCGACTVILDGRSVKACCVLAADVEGQKITTIEGVADVDELHPVQQAFVDKQGLQCGYCTPGMVLSTLQLLEENPDPTDTEIRAAIVGNLCRCTGYVYIVESIREAAARLNADSRDANS